MPEVSERTLWLVLPLVLVAGAYLASTLTEQVRNATLSPPYEEPPTARKVDDDAEEQIPVETLRVLSDGYSFELRNAAFKIALKQSLKDGPKTLLLKDLGGPEAPKRTQAATALYFLIYGPDEYDTEFTGRPLKLQQSHFQNLPTYRALITALVNVLPTHVSNPTPLSYASYPHPPSPTRPFLRTATEATLLKILLELLRCAVYTSSTSKGIDTFLKAGIVKRWLSHYPFPCTLSVFNRLNYKRADVTSLLDNANNRLDDPLMSDIFRLLTTSTAAERELQSVGLAHRSSRLRERFVDGDGDGLDSGWQTILPTRGERSAMELPRPRSSDERTAEEERVRRRHREAVVMADPDRPVSGRDILQRIDSSGPVRRGSALDIMEAVMLGDTTRRRLMSSSGPFEDDSEEEQEEMASMVSFSEIGDGASTADSMPSLRSVDAERQEEYETARREELERRLGARLVTEEESGVGRGQSSAAADILGDTLERALQARERARAASGADETNVTGGSTDS